MADDGISFATFNLLNLNRPGRRMYRGDDAWSGAEVRDKVAWTGSMIRRIGADVIGLQELWHREPLDQALAEAGLTNDYEVLVPPGMNGRAIACAALVRRSLAPQAAKWVADFPDAFRLQSAGEDPLTPAVRVAIRSFSRPVLRFTVDPGGNASRIQAFVAHFKSKRPTDLDREPWFTDAAATYKPHAEALGYAVSTVRRTAEAAALRVMLTPEMKDTATPVVVLGDLNNGQDSDTLNILTEQPFLLAPASRGGRDTALYSVQSLQELQTLRDVYYTHVHDGQHSSLDHILVSREFYPQYAQRSWTFRGIEIFNDHLPDGKAWGANDHGIVVARFKRGR